MTKLILEVDTSTMWRCSFYTSENQDGYENQCVLHNVGGCDGGLDLRPARCPLKIDDSEQKFEDFRAGVKNYLDLTDNLVGVITAGYEELSDKLGATIEMVSVLNTKINCLAVDRGIVSSEELSATKKETH